MMIELDPNTQKMILLTKNEDGELIETFDGNGDLQPNPLPISEMIQPRER